MGLQKAKRTGTGHSSNYWNISINNVSRDKIGIISLNLYKDHQAMLDGDDPTEEYTMRTRGRDWINNLAPDVLEAVGVNPRKKMYPWVKLNALDQIQFDLSDAVDIDPD